MIVSHKHKFIFVKTHKTAGSSLEMALGELCGSDDIISSMETNDDTGIPRNYYADRTLSRFYAHSRLLRKVIDRHSDLIAPWYYEHMPAWRIREQVGESVWSSYFKFCFERNPWDKVVSYYLWKKHGQQKPMPAFRDYVLKKSRRLPTDGELYLDRSGNSLLDEIYDFSRLTQDTEVFCARMGLELKDGLPREKTDIKVDRKPYQKYYDEETKQKVADLFSREIALIGYTF